MLAGVCHQLVCGRWCIALSPERRYHTQTPEHEPEEEEREQHNTRCSRRRGVTGKRLILNVATVYNLASFPGLQCEGLGMRPNITISICEQPHSWAPPLRNANVKEEPRNEANSWISKSGCRKPNNMNSELSGL